MSEKLSEEDWEVLMSRIKAGKCTPFIGAGACHGILPLAKDIANRWAEENNYPMEDIDDLGSVAQYLAITHGDPVFPKDKIKLLLEEIFPESFSAIDKSHGLLASLPLGTYITTNYDDFMSRTLQTKGKQPNRVLCQWNSKVKDNSNQKIKSFILKRGFESTPQNPIVFHLHGLSEIPESLVLTEDDYVDFIVSISKDQNTVIPHQIKHAITGHSLLFIGYSMKDWSFRVVFRGLVSQMENGLQVKSIAVQLPKVEKKQERYLNRYFDKMNIKVFWGDADEFIEELKKRWDKL